MTPEARLEYLGLVSNYTRIQAIVPWQKAAIQYGLAGDQFWQLGVSNLSFGRSTSTFSFSSIFSGIMLNICAFQTMGSRSTSTIPRPRPWSSTTSRRSPSVTTKRLLVTIKLVVCPLVGSFDVVIRISVHSFLLPKILC